MPWTERKRWAWAGDLKRRIRRSRARRLVGVLGSVIEPLMLTMFDPR
jgi:hypothetical protein